MAHANETLKRVLSAVIFIPIFFVTLFYEGLNSVLFSVIVLIIGLTSTYEMYLIGKVKGVKINIYLLLIFIFLIIVGGYLHVTYHEWFVTVSSKVYNYLLDPTRLIILFAIIILALEVYRKDFSSSLERIGLSLIILVYCGFFVSLIITVKLANPFYLLYLISICWLGDTFAYFGGREFGKHKLNLPVSPNKTLEGYLIGIFFGTGLTVLLFWYLLPSLDLLNGFDRFFAIKWYYAIIITLVFSILAFAGDLIESVFKRSSGVKDSTNIIPGHGGVLDVFDSLIYLSAIFYFTMALFFSPIN